MSINREIFKIAIPNVISNISIPLLGIVDTALMGRMDDPAYIGAIAIGGIIFNILYWSLGFLRPGTTGITAQTYGRGDLPECYRYLFRACTIAFACGFLLLVLRSPIGSLAFTIVNGSETVKALAMEYYSIRILAAPAVIGLMAFRGWFFGMQDAVSPMVLTITANITNIILSYYFVMHLNLSVAGVAYGTVIAQYVTLIIGFAIVLVKHHARIFRYIDRELFRGHVLQRFLGINSDMFIRNLGLILVFSYFTNYSAKLGESYLAVNEMLLQMFYFMSYSVDGFAYASESLVGKYIGKNNMPMINKVIRKCLLFGLGFGAVFSVTYLFFGSAFLRIFTNNEDLIALAKPYFVWLSLVGIAGALAFIWDGIYSGATASKELRNSMLISTAIFFTVFKLVSLQNAQIAIWAAMVAFMLFRSLFQIYFYRKKIEQRLTLAASLQSE